MFKICFVNRCLCLFEVYINMICLLCFCFFFMHTFFNLFCFDILLFWNKVNNATGYLCCTNIGLSILWGMSWIPGWAIELDDFLMELFLVTTFTWPGSSSCNWQLLEWSNRVWSLSHQLKLLTRNMYCFFPGQMLLCISAIHLAC